MAIPYKLNSVEIDFHSADCASLFYRLVTDTKAENKQKIAQLIQMEHQRWNVNMICNGWVPMQDLKRCLNGRKDKKNKQHPCIVPCGSKIVLENSWKQNNYEKWNTATNAEISQLDGLDQISIKVHSTYRKKAAEIRTQNLLPEHDIYEIRKLLANHPDASIAFSKYVLCLQNLNAGVSGQAKLYEYYKSGLLNSLKAVPSAISKLVTKRIETIEVVFFPILESEKYIDYKATDADLIRKIPFILTYRTNLHVAIPLDIESGKDVNNQTLFGNVAALLQINPSSVTCFMQYSSHLQTQIIRASRYMLNCLKAHNVRANINLCLMSETDVPPTATDEFSKISCSIKRIDVLQYGNEETLEQKLAEFIKHRRFTAIEKNNSSTSGVLYGMRCYRNNPYFTFDAIRRTFSCFNGCDLLRYIPFRPHLKISDLFESKGSRDSMRLPDFQGDYEFFWNLYKKSGHRSETVWKGLCNALASTDENENVLKIEISKDKRQTVTKEYYIENSYVDALSKILKCLENDNSTNIHLTFHSNSTYNIRVTAPTHIQVAIERIISNPYLSSNPFDLDVSADWKSVKIVFSNLLVQKLYLKTIEAEGQFPEEMIAVLKKLHNNGFIIGLQKGTDNIGEYFSFCYASHQIKSVMTYAGRILELYVYYKVLENSGFDEVANSVEVVWNKDGVENEFDIILTSGLRSIIVECKAQTTLKQDFYYKLFMLNKEFGINSIPVVVADTCENPNHDNSVNDMQRSRGNEVGITTIYQSGDISNIGNTLKALLKSN